MKVRDIPPQLFEVAEGPSATGAQREPFAKYVTLSAVVHGAVVLGLLGSVWLWGTPTYYKPSSYTVSLVDAPLTLRQSTQTGGGEKSAAPPAPVGDQQPAAPAESAAKPALLEPPPAPMKVLPAEPMEVMPAEPVKVIPAEPTPKATPPPPKAVAAPQEKKPEPKELKNPEPTEPKKPALAEPKKPVAPPAATTATGARQAIDKMRERQAQAQPAPPSATATEARQSVEKLRERQAQEAKVQAEATQAQQRTAEEKLAALRARYGTGGSSPGGGGPEGRATGSGGGGLLGDLQRIRLQAYQERVYELIRAAWILPMPQEEARKLQATALLIVSRDGHVARFQLLKTSGNPMFDESLLRAIKQAEPLPPLPDDYQAEALEVELRFKPRES
jgi:TonB family protein